MSAMKVAVPLHTLAIVAAAGGLLSLSAVHADVNGTSFLAPFPQSLPPPPPGPQGTCGEIGDLCCEDNMCAPGAACNAYEFYGNPDYYADAFFYCQECGGFVEDTYSPDYRIGQLACDDGAPCESGLEVYSCDGDYFPPSCSPCGQKREQCCNVGTACLGELQCLESGFCGMCGSLRLPPCPGPEGTFTCDGDLVARFPPPANNGFFAQSNVCLPALACGTDPGAECCSDGPACFGTDGFGTTLTCVEGMCERCGLRGTPPCEDGCVEGLEDVRGLCRGPSEPQCGQDGEECCGQDYNVPDYGSQCEEGFACDYGFGDYDAFAPSDAAAPPAIFLPFTSSATCKPCGGTGMVPCSADTPFEFGRVAECDDGLEPDYTDYEVLCMPSCGDEGGAPCVSTAEVPFLNVCPCKSGLLLTDGVCEIAPTRPSSPASAVGATVPTGAISAPATTPSLSTRRKGVRGGGDRERRPRGPRGQSGRRERNPRGESGRRARNPRGARK